MERPRVPGFLLAAGLAAVLAASGGAQADSWESMGPGSDTPPGLGPDSSGGRTFYLGFPSLSVPSRRILQDRVYLRPLPMLAYFRTDRGFSSTVQALQWVGHEWQAVGGSTEPSGLVMGVSPFFNGPPIAATGDSGTWVGWSGSEGNQLRWQGFGRRLVRRIWRWDSVSGSGAIPGITRDPDGEVRQVAATAQGYDVPFLAYTSGPVGEEDVFVRVLDGAGWSLLGPQTGASAIQGAELDPAIELYEGTPVVAWSHNGRVMLRRYDGAGWIGLGASDAPGAGIGAGRHPRLLNLDPERFNFTERRLVVTFEDTAAKALRVREWTGLSWTDLGDPLEPWSLSQTAPGGVDFFGQAVPSHDAALDFDNGIVVVFRAPVTVEGRTEFHLFASRYSRFTGEWTAVGDPAAEPTGLSRHPHDINAAGHVAPRIAIGLDHRPMVAWAFRPATNREHLLVRRLREPLPRIINPDLDQTLAPILGLVDPSPQNETRIDDGNDGVVDIADVRRLLFIP